MDPRPYHSRIFRFYIQFLETECHWTSVQIDQLLTKVGTSRERLADEGSWFDLKFADQFYEEIKALTNMPNIAYRAGLFIQESNFSAMTSLLASLVSVQTTYRLAEKLSAHFSKSCELRVIGSGVGTVTIEAKARAGYQERPYMCENRRGILAGTPSILGHGHASVNETECMFRGGTRCLYEIEWQESANRVWSYSVVGLVVATLMISFYFSEYTVGLFLSILQVSVGAALRFWRVLRDQTKRLKSQNENLHNTMLDVERRSKQMSLVAQISTLAHSSHDITSLSSAVVEGVCKLLEYDRAILLLTEPERSSLRFKSAFGFSETLEELLKSSEFNIRPDNTTGFFVAVVNTKAPVFIQNVAERAAELSPRSRKFAEMLGTKSFVAVPIFDQNREVQGVLAVDYVTEGKTLGISDQDLLMTLSENVGISLEQARLLDQLNSNLSTTQRVLKQQENLRSAFQKFVPTQVADKLIAVSDEKSVDASILKAVTKKEIGVLFLDIFDFSSLATKLNSEDIIDYLNITFEQLAPIIGSFSGFIDKFTGDGFMAVFEGPEPSLKACGAATQILDTLSDVNQRLQSKGYPPVQVGIGISLGQAILGNIGSVDRMNFTVIGDIVNLAARLESHTRTIGPNSICASSAVYNQCRTEFEWQELATASLKGYTKQVAVFLLRHHSKSTSTAAALQ